MFSQSARVDCAPWSAYESRGAGIVLWPKANASSIESEVDGSVELLNSGPSFSGWKGLYACKASVGTLAIESEDFKLFCCLLETDVARQLLESVITSVNDLIEILTYESVLHLSSR